MVLGVLLSAPDATSAILTLEPHDFYLNQHRQIFNAARWCEESGQEITVMTVYQRLKDAGHLESVGGITYLSGISGIPHIYGLESYLGTLRLKAALRRAALAFHEQSELMCMPGAGIEELRAADAALREISAKAEQNPPSLLNLGESMNKHGGMTPFMRPDRRQAIPSPWTRFNEMLSGGGFLPGQLVILGARPSLGKSACAALMALDARDRGVAVFSLEMGAREIWFRMIASQAGLPLRVVTEGDISGDDISRRLHAATTELSEKPLYVDDTTGANVPAIVAAVRKRPGIQMVILDYLQLVSPLRKRQNRAEEVSELSRSLKIAARDLQVPFLVLSQLNRMPAKDGRAPELQDLRESGSIEQDADIVLFLHAEPKEVKAAIQEKRASLLDLIVAKQRNGATGTVGMKFNPANMKIWEVDKV
jgi:replicative DNA helicase